MQVVLASKSAMVVGEELFTTEEESALAGFLAGIAG